MLYGLPIPILPTQPKRWNQHSLLKRIPSDSLFEEFALVLLRHKFIRSRRAAEARQQGHRGKRLTSASMMRRRMVAIEFGTWRSGRNGGSSGSVTVGYGKLREPRGGTRSGGGNRLPFGDQESVGCDAHR